MKVKNILENRKRHKFNFKIISKSFDIFDLLKFINKNNLGFAIVNFKNIKKIITDGDIRRYLCKNKKNLGLVNINEIGNSKIKTANLNSSLYDIAQILLKQKVNVLMILNKNNFISYLLKEEVIEFLSPERLVVEKSKISKYELDLKKHFIRYNFASLFAKKDFNVLDAACGTGYGSFILSKKSKNVLGVDNSNSAINHAKINYKSKNLRFINSDINKIKSNKKFDLIISLETLEHLEKKDAIMWIKKCSSLLEKNGILIISSPLLRIRNKKPFITNPHHLHEMKKDEFIKNLKKIINPKFISLFIQEENNFKPLTDEISGLGYAIIKK